MVVCESVEHGAGGSRVSFVGRNIFRPREAMTSGMRRDDMPYFERWSDKIQDEENVVPDENDEEVDDEAVDFAEDPDPHDCRFRIGIGRS